MDTPLKKWYCDVCGGSINDVNYGYVIWETNGGKRSHGFKIIHQKTCDLDSHPASAALEDFLGERGLVRLLSMLSLGPIKRYIGQGSNCDITDMDEFVDFMRRVQTPFYEEARRLFSNPDLIESYSDANELYPYLPDQLRTIINEYGNR